MKQLDTKTPWIYIGSWVIGDALAPRDSLTSGPAIGFPCGEHHPVAGRLENTMRAPILQVSEEWLERFKAHVRYDSETGNLYWLKLRRGVRKSNGLLAGSVKFYGYRYISFEKKELMAHRLVYMIHYGLIGAGLEIDHIDGNKANNRIENLRAVTHQGNRQNQIRPTAGNRTGFLGVWYNPARAIGKQYAATIRVGKSKFDLGSFATPEAAHQAYLEAKRRLHPGCTI